MKSEKWKNDLERKLENYDVISFDIFDTLIKRDCANTKKIYEMIEKNSKFYKGKVGGFVKLRYQSELELYKTGVNLTPNLEDIYNNIDIPNEMKLEMSNLEKEIEIMYACANKPIYDIYLKCKEQGKKIYAISDMYLSKEILIQMLVKCGYDIEKIWVSSECRANKASGELFSRFIQDTGIDRRRILHIGDNRIADIIGSKKQNIDSFLIPNKINNTYYYKRRGSISGWENDFVYPYINNHLPFIESRISQIGFETLGPMVYGFCQWLHQTKKQYSIDKLMFCARDVRQTMEIYRMLYPEDAVNTEYLCVSLKSLKKPYEAAIGKDTSAEAKEQLLLIREYLSQLGCSGKIAMVDSGCGGHTQHMLEVILDEMCEFHGLYMRISKNFPKNVQDEESFPYMFTKKASAKSYISGAFFETMLSATHGRTLAYEKNQMGIVVPIFGEENPKASVLQEFQEGIALFSKNWMQNYNNKRPICSSTVQENFLNLSFFPLKEDVNLLSRITGGNETYFDIVNQNKNQAHNKVASFLKNLKDTYWKGGFLCSSFKHYKWICKVYLLIDEMILNIIGF